MLLDRGGGARGKKILKIYTIENEKRDRQRGPLIIERASYIRRITQKGMYHTRVVCPFSIFNSAKTFFPIRRFQFIHTHHHNNYAPNFGEPESSNP